MKKRYLMSAMARNLGLIMRKMFGFGTARSLQANGALADAPQIAWFIVLNVMGRSMALFRSERSTTSGENFPADRHGFSPRIANFSTGCYVDHSPVADSAAKSDFVAHRGTCAASRPGVTTHGGLCPCEPDEMVAI